MRARQLRGITGIAQVLELNAFYNASGIHVQAGDDPPGQLLRWRRSFQESSILSFLIFPDGIALRKYFRARPRQKNCRRSGCKPPFPESLGRGKNACSRQKSHSQCCEANGTPHLLECDSSPHAATLLRLEIGNTVRQTRLRQRSRALPCCLRTATAFLRRFPETELPWRWRSIRAHAGVNSMLRSDRSVRRRAQQSFAQ